LLSKKQKHDKNFDSPKFKSVGAVKKVLRLNVVKTLNIGPHTHVQLSGPFLELMTIFGKFCQNWQKKSGGSIWRVTIFRHVLTTPNFCTSLQTNNNFLSFVKFWLVKKVFILKTTGLNFVKPKVKKMMKNFDPKNFYERKVRVSISVEYDSNHKLWLTYTPRTFCAILWINYNFWKLLSQIVKKMWLYLGSDLLKINAIFKNFTPTLRLLTYSQQPGAKSGLISLTDSEICCTAHLTPRKEKHLLNIFPHLT